MHVNDSNKYLLVVVALVFFCCTVCVRHEPSLLCASPAHSISLHCGLYCDLVPDLDLCDPGVLCPLPPTPWGRSMDPSHTDSPGSEAASPGESETAPHAPYTRLTHSTYFTHSNERGGGGAEEEGGGTEGGAQRERQRH